MVGLYEKVIKVKADVAAVLDGTLQLSEVAASAVKGVRRTFILTLDRDRHHPTLDPGTKQNRFCSASFLIRKNIVFFFLLT